SDDDDSTSDDDDSTSDDDDATSDDDDASDDDDSTSDDDDATSDDDDDATSAGPDPSTAGPLAFTSGSGSFSSFDGSSIPIETYIPSGAGPFPVIVFSHGFQLSPADYVSWGEHLAGWGYLTVMPDLPGSIIIPVTHVDLAAHLGALLDDVVARGASVSGPYGAVADSSAITLAGHSMGGKVSLLLASQDARPVAVFGIDPVDAGGGPLVGVTPDYPSVTPELMPQVTVPLVLLGETTNSTGGLGGACAPAADNFQQYFADATSPALEIDVLGANHMSFLDNPFCLSCLACPTGTDDPAVSRALAQGRLVAFLKSFVDGDASFDTWLTGAEASDDVSAGLVTWQTANGF
ncbi:MAG: hypothetical protein KDA24_27600, partial [Deltaproteobacteria bacterium]|nr:hypothetical protein [Deltaproteobacteria bacterium]